MRPITLTMNAFGTYLEETTIPFEQFGTCSDHGRYRCGEDNDF